MKKYGIILLILILIIIVKWKDKMIFPKTKEPYYFLQEGVYSNQKNINHDRETPSIIEKDKNKYYVYVGITNKKSIALKLKKIYEKMGYFIHIKEKKYVSEEFHTNLEQYDLLINSTNDKDEILTIEEVILTNYEETKKNSSKNKKLANNNKGKET